MTYFTSLRTKVVDKIVEHMQTRFFELENDPLSLEELLLAVEENGISSEHSPALHTMLSDNSKVVESEGKYLYKPPLKCRDKSSLMKYLIKQAKSGRGTLKDDITDSFACAEAAIRNLLEEETIIIVNRMDKKEVVYFNNNKGWAPLAKIDKKFQEDYRSVNVTHVEIKVIENYLKQGGLKPLEVLRPVKVTPDEKEKKRNRTSKPPKDNVHIASELHNYGNELGVDNQKRIEKETKNKKSAKKPKVTPKTLTSKAEKSMLVLHEG